MTDADRRAIVALRFAPDEDHFVLIASHKWMSTQVPRADEVDWRRLWGSAVPDGGYQIPFGEYARTRP